MYLDELYQSLPTVTFLPSTSSTSLSICFTFYRDGGQETSSSLETDATTATGASTNTVSGGDVGVGDGAKAAVISPSDAVKTALAASQREVENPDFKKGVERGKGDDGSDDDVALSGKEEKSEEKAEVVGEGAGEKAGTEAVEMRGDSSPILHLRRQKEAESVLELLDKVPRFFFFSFSAVWSYFFVVSFLCFFSSVADAHMI